jgi:hypothetical protein
MVNHKNEKWICDACGEETDSDKWTLRTYTAKSSELPITTEDYLILVCPNPKCKGSMVYKFSHHSHIRV